MWKQGLKGGGGGGGEMPWSIHYLESTDIPHGVLPTKKAVIEVMLCLLHPRWAGQYQKKQCCRYVGVSIVEALVMLCIGALLGVHLVEPFLTLTTSTVTNFSLLFNSSILTC